jgi:hypothetical protein
MLGKRESRMIKPSNIRLLFWSVATSALVNAFLISSAFASGTGGKKSLYVRLADLVAAPPGYISNQMFAPKEHTASAFATAALASLTCSFFFYAVVSWLILRTVLLLQSARARAG